MCDGNTRIERKGKEGRKSISKKQLPQTPHI
jgi:hypothetical protein